MLTKEQRDEIRAQTLRVIERDGGYTNGTGDTLALLDALDEMERERDAADDALDEIADLVAAVKPTANGEVMERRELVDAVADLCATARNVRRALRDV